MLREKISALSFNTLEIELVDAALVVTISRPKAFNALSVEVISELRELVSLLRAELGNVKAAGENDWSVRGVVLTGAGDKSFIAGADITQMNTMDQRQAQEYAANAQELTKWFEELPVPVIAAVNGYALGGGCELAMACDYIYASENALFGQPEVGLGLIPGFGGTVRLFRYVGAALAREIILTDRRLTAQEALAAGLVTRVFADSKQLLSGAIASINAAAKQSPVAIRNAKATMRAVESQNIAQGLETEVAAFAALFGTADMLEGTTAFVEKRKPNFPGA